jgi:hypothetical protein
MLHIPWYVQPEVWSAIGSCVAGAAAIAGLIGLWLYVRYTKRIMEATLASWRGQIEPVLVVEFDKNEDGHCHFFVRNAGNGPALNTSVWSMEQTDRGRFGKFIDRSSTSESADGLGLIRPDNPPGEDPDFSFPIPDEGKEGIYVVQAFDTTEGIHQKHITYRKTGQHVHMDSCDVTPRRSKRKST